MLAMIIQEFQHKKTFINVCFEDFLLTPLQHFRYITCFAPDNVGCRAAL